MVISALLTAEIFKLISSGHHFFRIQSTVHSVSFRPLCTRVENVKAHKYPLVFGREFGHVLQD